MRAAELGGKRVAIWGLGREGRAAIELLRREDPAMPLLLLDDKANARAPGDAGDNFTCAFGADPIAAALDRIDLIVKSPGVSLYRPEIAQARAKGVKVTSLLNLWFAEPHDITTVCVTGTKGKSTTAALIAHILRGLGRRVALAGNIGVAVTAIDGAAADYAVIEMSSYQTADFDGICDIAVLTSLYPEHADWHGTLENYYRDKIHLLTRAHCAIFGADTAAAAKGLAVQFPVGDSCTVRACDGDIFDGGRHIGRVRNPYLARPHNRSNLCLAVAVAKRLGADAADALAAAEDFRGLPHRQQELGTKDGLLFVDDSISTIPESTIAALAVYAGRPVTVILGGYDRGLDYGKLITALSRGAPINAVCLGVSGERLFAEMRAGGFAGSLHRAQSMEEAVAIATAATPQGGVVLLSPAAPSYGWYRDFAERGLDFAAKAGFPAPAERGR
ncbi:MAG TPA: UDP-N-acetylmuramoyl-L-alanine--D-glutamate ligase [Stellaceae bacterium]|jgi:UDP-N-acetylmuramoylalanine--D-glutamate ligase